MLELPGYIIKEQIGKGGMARVYLALHEGLDRQVAIKVMSKHLDDDDSSFSDRFIREARIVAKLSHQNIITVFDVGVHDGYNYITMELVPGITLDDKIKDGLSEQQALITMKQVASALDYAHAKGIVHRDVKPENIMYREDGSAVLTDFGIARSTTSAKKMTATCTVIGTPHYMSPEQAQGQEVGSFSDIYSLGVVFYEMLTGKVPYDADSTIAIVFKHITEPIPAIGDAHIKFQPLIDKLLAKDPKDRYQSGKEIISDIEQLEQGVSPDNATLIYNQTAINAAVTRADLKQHAGAGKNKIPLFAGIMAVIIIAAVGAVMYTSYQDEVDEQAKTQRDALLTQKNKQKQAALEEKRKAALVKQAQDDKKIAAELAEKKQLSAKQKKLEQERLTKQRAADRNKKERKAALIKKNKQQRLAKQEKIENLLSRAEAHLFNERLNKAYKTFKNVLKIDPRNRSAKNGINRVADQYLALANNEALGGNFDQANKYISSVIRIAPTHKNLTSTQQKVFDIKNRTLVRKAERQRLAQEKQTTPKEKKKRRSFGGF